MPQSLSSLLTHIVFSTKNRQPFIRPEIEPELHPYMASIFRDLGCPALSIGGTADHVHCFCSMSRTETVAKVIEKVKSGSSKWIKTRGKEYAEFFWQTGYGAFSIGQSGEFALKTYIANQKEHHRSQTFQDEFRAILTQHRVAYDERYVWD